MIARNSVILIDEVARQIEAGQHVWDAVVNAAIHRTRPILLTASAATLGMLPSETETRSKAFDLIREVMSAAGKLSAEDEKRLREIAGLFGLEPGEGTTIPFPRREQAKAS